MAARRISKQDAADRQDELREQLRYCQVSRDARRADASTLRNWYENGTDSGVPATCNKLRSHLDKLGSYLWSPDSLRFATHLPPATRAGWLAAAATARDEFRQVWTTSGADLAIGFALEWSLVYGGVPIKVTADAAFGFQLSSIDPWDFGVTREDQALDDQDVVAHWYALSIPQFRRWVHGHPRADEWLRLAEERKRPQLGDTGPSRLVVSGTTGVFPDSEVTSSITQGPYDSALREIAQVLEPIVILADVWERRLYPGVGGIGPFEDWRVTTVFPEDATVLTTRRNPILPHTPMPSGVALAGELPFTLVCPRPLPGYLWGHSELSSLMGLQVWHEDYLQDLRSVLKKQLKPPKFMSGFSDWEEQGRALDTPGGTASSGDPTAKVQPIQIQVSQEAYLMQDKIGQYFSEQSGIPPIIGDAQQPPGVRANNQLVSLAGIGAGRVRHMALALESALSRAATLCLGVLRRNDGQTYTAEDGTKFLLAQLPPGLALQVMAHSASPIFAEQVQAKAFELHKAGAIDAPLLVELVDPPHREEAKEVAKKLAASRAQHQERMIDLELAKLQKRGGRVGGLAKS